jgi:hypothetical protein
MGGSKRILRVTVPVALAACALVALGPGGGMASGSAGAGASRASCHGHAVNPTQTGRKIRAKATLDCTGAVATQRIRTCLEQLIGSAFRTVKCVTVTKHAPGRIQAVAERSCAPSEDHGFRTRAFLFLKDTSGGRARGKVISEVKDFPKHC